VIGYDAFGVVAAYLATSASIDAELIYHNFDLATGESTAMRSLIAMEGLAARHARAVLTSSPARAAELRDRARLGRDPIVLMNCQRLSGRMQKTGELHQRLRDGGFASARIVLRLGTLGPGHGIEATLRSVPQWKGNAWTLVLAGSPTERYLRELSSLVETLGLQNQVLLLPSVSREFWYDCLYSADLGIALYELGNINHASMAGAGNKLNLYLKAGIPSVVPALPDFETFLHLYGGGEAADPRDPASIARAVNSILGDSEKYASFCRAARAAFESEFNFEKQAGPLLDEVLASCQDAAARMAAEPSNSPCYTTTGREQP
jgi:glycosyltransferase involved in cell wall biosynthesis